MMFEQYLQLVSYVEGQAFSGYRGLQKARGVR